MPCNIEAIKSEFKRAVRETIGCGREDEVKRISCGLTFGNVKGLEVLRVLGWPEGVHDWVATLKAGDHTGNSMYAELMARWIAEVLNETDECEALVKTLAAKWNHLREADTSVEDDREEFNTMDVINALLGKGE